MYMYMYGTCTCMCIRLYSVPLLGGDFDLDSL